MSCSSICSAACSSGAIPAGSDPKSSASIVAGYEFMTSSVYESLGCCKELFQQAKGNVRAPAQAFAEGCGSAFSDGRPVNFRYVLLPLALVGHLDRSVANALTSLEFRLEGEWERVSIERSQTANLLSLSPRTILPDKREVLTGMRSQHRRVLRRQLREGPSSSVSAEHVTVAPTLTVSGDLQAPEELAIDMQSQVWTLQVY